MIIVPEKDSIEVLLIEDNPADIELMKEAFEAIKTRVNLLVATDGEQALNILHKKDRFSNTPRPDIIILDLNLPGHDGRKILDMIKQDPVCKIIPVIILTSSEEDRDVIMCYMLQANCYIAKPADFEGLTNVIKTIESFWFKMARLP